MIAAMISKSSGLWMSESTLEGINLNLLTVSASSESPMPTQNATYLFKVPNLALGINVILQLFHHLLLRRS